MPDTIVSLVEKVVDAAVELEDPEVLRLARAVQEYAGTSRLQILVVGSTGSGRSSIVDALVEAGPGGYPLPRSPLPKAPLSIQIQYGPSDAVEAIGADGARTALPSAKLRAFLMDPATALGPHATVLVHAPCRLLMMCDLQLEALDVHCPDGYWRDLLASTDFVILVLNATALLSHQEREFVRWHLAEGYGLQRVAIIVNQMDLVPEEERASIIELVRTFLGPFESQPAVLELSATAALQEMESNNPSRSSGYDALRTVVGDVLERHTPVRGEALRESLESVLGELEEGVTRQRALLSIDQDEVVELRQIMASRREWLEKRVERTQHRVDTFVGTLVKEELVRAGMDFGEMFRRRLPDEIMQVEDINVIKRYLPGYIEAAWGEFLNHRMIAVRSKLIGELSAIDRLVDGDLGELLENHVQAREVLGDFGLAQAGIRSFVMPKRGKHRVSGLIKGLSLHGYIMLFVNPTAGILSLVASHVIRRGYKSGLDASEVKALAAAATSAARELERELLKRIEEQFTSLTAELKVEVATLYAEGVAAIEEFLDRAAAQALDVEERGNRLEALTRETIPRLRILLQQLDTRVVA